MGGVILVVLQSVPALSEVSLAPLAKRNFEMIGSIVKPSNKSILKKPYQSCPWYRGRTPGAASNHPDEPQRFPVGSSFSIRRKRPLDRKRHVIHGMPQHFSHDFAVCGCHKDIELWFLRTMFHVVIPKKHRLNRLTLFFWLLKFPMNEGSRLSWKRRFLQATAHIGTTIWELSFFFIPFIPQD